MLGGRGGSNQRRRLLASVVLLLLVSTPVWMHREYLGRRYGHASSEAAIRHLLAKVPEGCVVAVPDDRAEGVDIEIHHRYVNIAAEAFAQGQVRAVEVVPASDLLERATSDRGCALFLRGPYCYHAYAGGTAEVCRRIEERFVLEPIDAVSIEFRHHRLVTGPDVSRAPWYMADMPIVLYRITDATRPRTPE